MKWHSCSVERLDCHVLQQPCTASRLTFDFRLPYHEGHEEHEGNPCSRWFGIVLEPIRVILAELSMNFGSTTDYALGKILEFRLRALRVLRGESAR